MWNLASHSIDHADQIREGLSISLNARLNPDRSRFRLFYHKILVATGRRSSISSILRTGLLSECTDTPKPEAKLPQVVATLSTARSIPCHIIPSDSKTTMCLSKDLLSARSQSFFVFIVQTNHDHDQMHLHHSNKNPFFLDFLKKSSDARSHCWEMESVIEGL